jgi:serine phosphatase RsbU (regulator of sigma subunit)
MYTTDANDLLRQLTSELKNFEDIAKYLLPLPGEVPKLHGVDVSGGTLPLTGAVGGDHIIYVDFKQRFDLQARVAHAREAGQWEVVKGLERCQRMAGIALIDVSGHQVTDALLAAMMHQAFLLGAIYELDMFGQITKRLFENLNTRFYKSSGAHKFIAMTYGEISEDAKFRFLSAGQPPPAVFSRECDRLMDVSAVQCPPIGIMPSLGMIDEQTTKSPLGFTGQYELNEWSLMGAGDVVLLHTDGLSEHRRGPENYVPTRLEHTLRQVKNESAANMFAAIKEDVMAFNAPSDDISLVVIKRL